MTEILREIADQPLDENFQYQAVQIMMEVMKKGSQLTELQLANPEAKLFLAIKIDELFTLVRGAIYRSILWLIFGPVMLFVILFETRKDKSMEKPKCIYFDQDTKECEGTGDKCWHINNPENCNDAQLE